MYGYLGKQGTTQPAVDVVLTQWACEYISIYV
jgi:hypothetical protein